MILRLQGEQNNGVEVEKKNVEVEESGIKC
jgi:hypothetical protein